MALGPGVPAILGREFWAGATIGKESLSRLEATAVFDFKQYHAGKNGQESFSVEWGDAARFDAKGWRGETTRVRARDGAELARSWRGAAAGLARGAAERSGSASGARATLTASLRFAPRVASRGLAHAERGKPRQA